MRVRAKICGITRAADARAAVDAGCDALGFNFYRGSPRFVTPAQAKEIVVTVPPFVTCVGVFVDATPDEARRDATQAGVGVLQFHGDETDERCRAAGFPFIKAVNVATASDVAGLPGRFPHAMALLLDTGAASARGGTGTTFDWSIWPRSFAQPLILAGGLTANNVAEAIARTHPYAVDVASGVEGAKKGEKDSAKLVAFMREVRRAG